MKFVVFKFINILTIFLITLREANQLRLKSSTIRSHEHYLEPVQNVLEEKDNLDSESRKIFESSVNAIQISDIAEDRLKQAAVPSSNLTQAASNHTKTIHKDENKTANSAETYYQNTNKNSNSTFDYDGKKYNFTKKNKDEKILNKTEQADHHSYERLLGNKTQKHHQIEKSKTDKNLTTTENHFRADKNNYTDDSNSNKNKTNKNKNKTITNYDDKKPKEGNKPKSEKITNKTNTEARNFNSTNLTHSEPASQDKIQSRSPKEAKGVTSTNHSEHLNHNNVASNKALEIEKPKITKNTTVDGIEENKVKNHSYAEKNSTQNFSNDPHNENEKPKNSNKTASSDKGSKNSNTTSKSNHEHHANQTLNSGDKLDTKPALSKSTDSNTSKTNPHSNPKENQSHVETDNKSNKNNKTHDFHKSHDVGDNQSGKASLISVSVNLTVPFFNNEHPKSSETKENSKNLTDVPTPYDINFNKTNKTHESVENKPKAAHGAKNNTISNSSELLNATNKPSSASNAVNKQKININKTLNVDNTKESKHPNGDPNKNNTKQNAKGKSKSANNSEYNSTTTKQVENADKTSEAKIKPKTATASKDGEDKLNPQPYYVPKIAIEPKTDNTDKASYDQVSNENGNDAEYNNPESSGASNGDSNSNIFSSDESVIQFPKDWESPIIVSSTYFTRSVNKKKEPVKPLFKKVEQETNKNYFPKRITNDNETKYSFLENQEHKENSEMNLTSGDSYSYNYEPEVFQDKFLSSSSSAMVELENESLLFNGADQTDLIFQEISIDMSVEKDKERLYSFLKKKK